MKRNIARQLLSLALPLLFLLASCDDTANNLGIDTMPDYMRQTGFTQQLDLGWRTVSADLTPSEGVASKGTSYNNIYVTSQYGYVGDIPNMLYGRIHSEYLTQLYCPRGFKFAEEPIEGKVDSVSLYLYYSSYTGDSIAPMSVEVYRLSKSLPNTHYTLSDISDYVSDELMGKSSYYAGRANGSSSSGLLIIDVPLPKELGQEIYDRSKAGDAIFANQAAFDAFLPGFYITAGAGTGSILRIQRTALTMHYKTQRTLKTRDGKRDSLAIVNTIQQLSHTSEVPQLSRFANEGIEELVNTPSSAQISYVKSPAGVVTELTIPTKEIQKILQEAPNGKVRSLNAVPLTLYGEPQGSGEYDLELPSNLLLLPRDSVASFFEKELTEIKHPYTTFVASRTSTTSGTYIFGNIASLVLKHIKAHPNEDLHLWVVPVDRTTSGTSNSGSSKTTTSISNLVLPSAVKFNFADKKSKLPVVITERSVGAPF